MCENRKNTVFGEGNEDTNIMFVGEGPALLRDPDKKRDAWNDFKSIREKLKERNATKYEENA